MAEIRKAGVVGWPVSHSLSPRLHGFWLKQYNIAGEYSAYPVEPENLKNFIASLRTNGMRGINLTIPHKETVMPLLDEVDNLARCVGAVNTIIVKNQKLLGTNTDIYGFAENIRASITGKNKAVVLGAGGAAYAVCHALIQEGFKEVRVTNRTAYRAKKLGTFYNGHIIVDDSWEQRGGMLRDVDLLVNTTSLGMKGNPALEIDLSLLPENALITDIVYNPLETTLLAQARAAGYKNIVDGLGMLMHQAASGFEAWFGVKPEVTKELRAHLLEGFA